MSTRSSARNLFPSLDNPELTIRRRSHVDPTLLNDLEMAAEGNSDLPVLDLQTMELCQSSLNGQGGPIGLITFQATNFGLKNDMIQQVQNSCQFHGLSGDDANKHLDKSLHVTQRIKVNGVIDDALHLYLFPHSLTHHATSWFDRLLRNSINTFEQLAKMFLGKYFPPSMVSEMKSPTSINVSMSHYSKHGNVTSFQLINVLTTTSLKAEMAKINKNLMRVLQVNQQVKAVTPSCETCGSPHSYTDCPATIGQTQNVYAAGAYQGGRNQFFQGASHGQNPPLAYQALAYQASSYQAPVHQPSIPQPQVVTTNEFTNFMKMNTVSSLGSRTLPGDTITNPKEDLKGITTRSGTAYQGPMIPTTSSSLPKVVERESETETPIQNFEPIVAPIIKPVAAPVSASKPNPKLSIPYPSRFHYQKLYDKANDQKEKFFQIFKDLDFNISFADALILMPKFSPTIKTLLTNEDKHYELARTPLNEYCSAVLLKKLPEKLGDPVVDFDADPREPLILETSFLNTRRALIDVFEGELTLRVGKKAITFNLDQTSRYAANYNDMTANRIDVINMASKTDKSSIDEPPEVKLKDLPPHLEYAFLEGDDKLQVIIAKDLSDEEKTALITILKSYKVNPKIHDVIKKEVLKLLDAGLIYPISDSPWVSPVHCVSKRGGFTVVENEENELILTRLVMGWRVCIDYHKLNEATRKDHFPLSFMYQMLENLAGNEYYCFLDGFSGYFQISIDQKDQEKATFTCPYGTFTYHCMPFGLCNAPGTFQRCMMAIFHDMIEKMMEVFMDDFSVFGNSFKICLSHLEKMLKRVNVIAKLPHPTTVKGIRSFLGHVGFYRRFIQDFSKIARPMTRLLEKDTPFFFSKKNVVPTKEQILQGCEALFLRRPLFVQNLCGSSHPKERFRNEMKCLKIPSKFVKFLKIFDVWGIDLMGSFPSSRGNKYILVAVDYLSKRVEAKALPTNDARVVCKFLKSLFARFGTPRAIISDRSMHFCNDQFAKVMLNYGVTHRLATVYHPQTSGQVEVSNHGLKRILEKTVGENRASWSNKLDDALWAFRTAYKTPIGCTPYKLVYRKACHLPIELEHKAYWSLKHANFDLQTAGDHCKLKTRWSGPFTITHVFPYGTVELSQTDRLNFKVNGHKLKHYFGEAIPKIVVLDL
nr:reverse transcriptase domain-containing protein [Tanacetum cinerariifolium]